MDESIASACLIAGCDKLHHANGWCEMHYARWRRNGNTDLQTPYKAPGKFFREVAVYEGDECVMWPFAHNLKGYGLIGVNRRNRLVSRLLCEQEHGPPPTPKHQAAHSCGNGHLGCVTKHHLSWKTCKENHDDQATHGTRLIGERRPLAKLKDDQVRIIKSLVGQIGPRPLAVRFGVSRQAIELIAKGKTWTHIK